MIASRVGVLPPGRVPMIELVTFAPLIGAIGTAGAPLLLQGELSEKYLRPQLTVMSVFCTTVESAVVRCVHFELAPQPFRQLVPLSSSSIDPDLSWMMRMSGGSGMTGTLL